MSPDFGMSPIYRKFWCIAKAAIRMAILQPPKKISEDYDAHQGLVFQIHHPNAIWMDWTSALDILWCVKCPGGISRDTFILFVTSMGQTGFTGFNVRLINGNKSTSKGGCCNKAPRWRYDGNVIQKHYDVREQLSYSSLALIPQYAHSVVATVLVKHIYVATIA